MRLYYIVTQDDRGRALCGTDFGAVRRFRSDAAALKWAREWLESRPPFARERIGSLTLEVNFPERPYAAPLRVLKVPLAAEGGAR